MKLNSPQPPVNATSRLVVIRPERMDSGAMPRVTESVVIAYCDFCGDTKSRAAEMCELCGQLLCHEHVVTVGFRLKTRPPVTMTPKQLELVDHARNLGEWLHLPQVPRAGDPAHEPLHPQSRARRRLELPLLGQSEE